MRSCVRWLTEQGFECFARKSEPDEMNSPPDLESKPRVPRERNWILIGIGVFLMVASIGPGEGPPTAWWTATLFLFALGALLAYVGFRGPGFRGPRKTGVNGGQRSDQDS